MTKPTLVILAAGMGSRYGGMKQIDGVGSHGEPIIEFSIYDAVKAGFGKVVLIIKKEHEEAFRTALTDRLEGQIEVEFAYQDLYDVPEDICVPEGRVKPWGTTHALLACRDVVKEPFAIINADDFYGRDAYETICHFLQNDVRDGHYAMVGYPCMNTLTENGTVTRGLCEKDAEGDLSHIVELKEIALRDGHAVYKDGEEWKRMADDSLVSMNFWGFTPAVFPVLEKIFDDFIHSAITQDPLKCEHVIPTAVGRMVEEKSCTVKMLSSKDRWFGVTYKEDKPEVVKKIAELKNTGVYPDVLWK